MSDNSAVPDTAPDTAHSALITTHPYKTTQQNLLCDECGMGQASHSHEESVVYKIPESTPFRCASCIAKGVTPCPHQQKQ